MPGERRTDVHPFEGGRVHLFALLNETAQVRLTIHVSVGAKATGGSVLNNHNALKREAYQPGVLLQHQRVEVRDDHRAMVLLCVCD